VLAWQLGKVSLAGGRSMSARAPQIGDTFLHDGELLTLDGNEGVFHAGAARLEID